MVLPHRCRSQAWSIQSLRDLQQGWATVTYSISLLWILTHIPWFLVSLLCSLTALPEITSQINNLHPNSCLKGLFGEWQRECHRNVFVSSRSPTPPVTVYLLEPACAHCPSPIFRPLPLPEQGLLTAVSPHWLPSVWDTARCSVNLSEVN